MNNPKTIKQVKLILKNLTGLGISMICVAATTMIISGGGTSGKLKKSLMLLGGMAIGGMIAKNAEEYIDKEVDTVSKFMNGISIKIEKPKENSTVVEG